MLRIAITLTVAMLGSTTHAIELSTTSMTEFDYQYMIDVLEDGDPLKDCLVACDGDKYC